MMIRGDSGFIIWGIALRRSSHASRPNGEVQTLDFTRPANRLGAISM